ncbi:hypothetical protein UA08_08629 [Talaromyces atroroseus]|uniref:Uncharacterized protein n=1 Tax=Talaromyces atroroseus TaxID=1441469 RepID=A0A225ANP9_TALAT|nr:hypothetical protein UA08_08629 [Talaromyces atroroseus]OKL56055.1 hypothetical protein UA08_08629 [Talaromyces atroroseus]
MDGGSEDVNEFLLRIRELGDKRVKEDEERTRKLEEEILQGRKERQARRAERARSISPTKDFASPVTPTSALASHKSFPLLPPQVLQPSGNSFEQDALSSLKAYCEEPHHESGRSIPSTPPRQPELSSVTKESAEELKEHAAPEKTPLTPQETMDTVDDTMPLEEDVTPSRSQISQALSSKDPTWFRQTADREKSSLALRRSAENTMSETSSTEGSFRLPGLTRDSTAEPEKARDWVGEDRSRSPSRASSTFAANSSIGNRYSSVSSVSTSGLGSPVPLSTQRLDARKTEQQPSNDDRAPLSPSRTSPERSVSPTKGLGGFVQSAMMKRSDSISKRWSVQSPANLSRSNSIVSNRSGVGRSAFGSDMLPDPKPIREHSPLSPSRPGSSHSEATVVHHTKSNGVKDNDQEKIQGDTSFTKPSLHTRTRSSVSSVKTGTDEAIHGDVEPQTPRSPSKSIDQKRWSPTKSSWLESALNRPESPRTKTTPVTQQPAWLRDLSKARQSRASVDLGRPASSGEATPSGLMRSPQIGSHSKSPSASQITISNINATVSSATEDRATPDNDKNAQLSTSDVKDNIEITPNDSNESVAATSEVDSKPSSISKAPPPALPNKPKTVAVTTDHGVSHAKPQPGVVDFRSNLRRREATSGSPTQAEPEFKNVFGKLRKTEKSNYKAPDVFKDNIMKGKAALNATGGPKKSDRVDEFRESILKQKDAMKAGGGSIRRTGEENGSIPSKPPVPIPEALSRRTHLTRTDSTKSNLSSFSSTSPTKSSELEGRPRPLSVSTSQTGGNSPSVESSPQLPLAASTIEPKKPLNMDPNAREREPDSEASSLLAVLTEENKNKETGPPVRPLPSKVLVGASTKTTAEPRGLTTKGHIADRLNPALAGMLSRGPPRSGGETENSANNILSTSLPTPSTQEPEPKPRATLTHMTKGRARGPKRRLPASNKSGPKQAKEEGGRSRTELNEEKKSVSESVERKPSSENVRSPPVPAKKLDTRPVLPSIPDEPAVERRKPLIPSKSPDIPKSVLISPDSKASPLSKEQSVSNQPSNILLSKSHTSPAIPPKSGSLRKVSTSSDKNPPSNEKPTPPPKSAPLPSTPTPSNATPSPSFTSKLKDTIVNSANTSPLQTRFGLGMGLGSSFFQSRPESPLGNKKSSQLNKSPASPPVPPKKNLTISSQVSDGTRRPSLTSPVPRTSESAGVISEFFDTVPKSSDRVDIDPQLVLTTETDELKTRTIRKQIWEITGDGKKQDLPIHQEYILFEGSMTEAYLWLGDEVAEAAMEDAQIFARRVARENGARLELIRQGKEPAKFVEALGGIMITRRGSSSRSSSSALYMLCGRRHLGQIAFDEVDVSRRSLCSGFPFVISAKFGKLYLWKGKGSGADEVGGARLIGMNLGLTGEIEEVSEGEEPESFFDVFPDSKTAEPMVTSEHWHLKPRHDKYRCRLLRIDHMLGQKGGFWNRRGSSSPVTRPNDTVQEIDPFCQKDLRFSEIYILDAFFEIYVIIGRDAKSRPAEFASALVFAHEYGILAVSLQDRPFIPKSYVAMGGIPDCCTVAFRKWDRKLWATTPHILPLNAAIEAIRS